MEKSARTAKELFDQWAVDYHADGMEQGHIQSVKEAFKLIRPSQGNYFEVGFGNGYGIEYMASNQYSNGTCFGLDISDEMYKRALAKLKQLPNIHLYTGDFLSWMPPDNAVFSCIFSMEVFYYFKNMQSGIDKAASLLTSGGMLMVLVNYYTENKESLSWPDDVNVDMSLWSEKEYAEGFYRAGLTGILQKRLNKNKSAGTLMTLGFNPN
ncbi:class I SAM-dependent methyltransferase [bacterium]|nr:class I SAM-dependent methyltransferase [bacterium]